MVRKIINVIIFLAIAAGLFLGYVYFIKAPADQKTLISTQESSLPDLNGKNAENLAASNSLISKDFLALLLNVRNIKLDDAIFSDLAFNSLRDSSITLIPDGTEGRKNPFAQLGSDPVSVTPLLPLTCTLPQVLDTTTNTCITPVAPKP